MCCHNQVSWIILNTPHVWPNLSNSCVQIYCAFFSKLVRLQAELAFRRVMHRYKTKHYVHACYLCRAMTVTQWSVTWLMSTITPGDRGGVPPRIKDISLVHFALLPSALVPLVSRKETFPPPPHSLLLDFGLFAYI